MGRVEPAKRLSKGVGRTGSIAQHWRFDGRGVQAREASRAGLAWHVAGMQSKRLIRWGALEFVALKELVAQVHANSCRSGTKLRKREQTRTEKKQVYTVGGRNSQAVYSSPPCPPNMQC